MKEINVSNYTTRPVPLGRQGENEVTQVVIPVSDIFDEFGDTGSFTLVVRRSGDTLIYPPESVTWDDENVTWTVSATDTAKSGRGKFGLRYAVGDKAKWSQIWESYVEPTLDMEQEDQPDVYTSFLEELSVRTAELHQDIEGITDEAKGYAEAAAASAASITLPLPITSGGTGSTTAEGAVTALGLNGLQSQIDNILDEDVAISESNLWQHLQACALSESVDNQLSAKMNKRVLTAETTGSTTGVVYFSSRKATASLAAGDGQQVAFTNIVNANYLVLGAVSFGAGEGAYVELVEYDPEYPRTFYLNVRATTPGEKTVRLVVAAIHKNWLNQ